MAVKKTIPQSYPRIQDDTSRFYGFLDESTLKEHTTKLDPDKVKELIIRSIKDANKKSSRQILNIEPGLTEEQTKAIYIKEGVELFKYFKKYCGDPASSSFDAINKHYSTICHEQFRNRTLQKQRMNSGWRYQFLAQDCANHTNRFSSVSDIGAAEADFNVVADYKDPEKGSLSIYISVKNRTNTMGGQDWPKAIYALEDIAKTDKNRRGEYLCVFGITMDRGVRTMKRKQTDKRLYSPNTELWLSDFFWPFFSNMSYSEIMIYVLEAIMDAANEFDSDDIEVPNELVESFGECCFKLDLLDDKGVFNDPKKLVKFFCNTIKWRDVL